MSSRRWKFDEQFTLDALHMVEDSDRPLTGCRKTDFDVASGARPNDWSFSRAGYLLTLTGRIFSKSGNEVSGRPPKNIADKKVLTPQ